jgi:hypothetical protein
MRKAQTMRVASSGLFGTSFYYYIYLLTNEKLFLSDNYHRHDHDDHDDHWHDGRTPPNRRRGRYEGRDSRRRRVASPRYVFYFFLSYYTCTNYYFALVRLRTPPNRRRGRHEGRGSRRRRVASPESLYIVYLKLV